MTRGQKWVMIKMKLTETHLVAVEEDDDEDDYNQMVILGAASLFFVRN